MPCLSDYASNNCNNQVSYPQIPTSNCQPNCQPIEYQSTSYSQSCAEFNVPTYCDKNSIVFTATDFSQQLACGVGREVSFAAFMQMGSSLANAAQAMIVLAMDQCNNVLNENEALIATPTSSSSTTTTTIYHQSVCSCDNAPAGATDEYIQNWTDSNGVTHQEITYVDKNGVEVGKRDYVLDTKGLTVSFATGGDKQGTGVYAAGDTVTVSGKNYILVDTGKTDADGHKIFNLDTLDSSGKDTGVSVGSVSFNSNGTVDHSAILDYSSISTDAFIPGFQSVSTTTKFDAVSATVNIVSTGLNGSIMYNGNQYSRDGSNANNDYTVNGTKYDAFKDASGDIVFIKDSDYMGTGNKTINVYTSATYDLSKNTISYKGDTYARDLADDKFGYYAYKDTKGNIEYVSRTDIDTNSTHVSFVTLSTPAGLPDAYSTYENGGTGVTLTELSSTTGAPTANSTQTNVTDTTADPLTTMAAVFKYAEVYAEAMTMISTYYQNNIDAYKNRPH